MKILFVIAVVTAATCGSERDPCVPPTGPAPQDPNSPYTQSWIVDCDKCPSLCAGVDAGRY